MTKQPDPSSTNSPQNDRAGESGLSASLQRLTAKDAHSELRFGARLRNYFLTGLLVVGPVTITIYIIWWFINVADAWIKPLVPGVYLPETYLPFAVPGISLLFGVAGLTLIGALTANLLGRTLVSYGEQMLGRTPIVRNVYNALKQIFESAVTATGSTPSFQKVGLIEFPSKGLWSVVFVTGETSGEIQVVAPGGESDLLTVFIPTGIVPPQGFICFVPRKDVTLLKMSSEDAAKIVISAGMVTPDYQGRLDELAAKARADELVEVAGKALADAPSPQAGEGASASPADPTARGSRKQRKAARREARTK